MSTCGYVCPKCEGLGFTDEGEVCDWCSEDTAAVKDEKETEKEEN